MLGDFKEGFDMEYELIIYYFALFLSLGSVAEIFVRWRGLGVAAQKYRGNVVVNKPKLMAPVVLLIASVLIAVMKFPG